MKPHLDILKKNKVFGIGLSRTGTTSLHYALQVLGFRSIHNPIPIEAIEKYDAACDIPVAIHFKKLDAKYPNAKFILTIRDLDQWLESCERHFLKMDLLMDTNKLPKKVCEQLIKNRLEIYGVKTFYREAFTETYKKHLEDVQSHFSTRKNKLLEINITAGDEWQELCNFLSIEEIPKIGFPHLNKA